MSEQTPSLYTTLARVVLFAAGIVVLLWLFVRIEMVLLATLLSVIIAVALNAPVEWLERKNISRGGGIAITFVSLLAIIILLGMLVVPRLAQEIPTLLDQVPEMVDTITASITTLTGESPQIERQISRVVDWVFTAVEGVWRYTGEFFTGLVMIIFVIALVLYMVANMRTMLGWYVRSMAPRHRDAATQAFAVASKMVIGWVMASVILGGMKAGAAFVFLTLMGVPGAIVWSLIGFLAAFIPRVGFYLMTIPTVLVAFTVDPMVALWTFLFLLALSEFLGNFIAPRIYEHTMQLNAVFILVMTLAMGVAFGILGVLIATPVAGFIKAYYDAFYLDKRPDDPDVDQRIRAMMRRSVPE